MISLRTTFALMVVMVAVLLAAAGCMGQPDLENQTGTLIRTPVISMTPKSMAFYKVTIAQPNNSHAEFIKMDSDVYNQGEVVEFYVVNEGSETLTCWTPPSIHLYRQIGTWELQTEPVVTHSTYGYSLKPGESTPSRQLSTANRIPGHYKIVADCGVSREFEIRQLKI